MTVGIVLSLILAIFSVLYPRKTKLDVRYHLELASLYQISGRNDDAGRVLADILASGVSDTEVLGSVGEQYRLLRNYPKSIEILEKVVNKRPISEVYLLSLARSYESAGIYQEAIDIYQRLVEINPITIYYSEMATVYEKSNEPRLALETYQSILELFPSYWQAHSAQGDLLMKLGHFIEAEIQYMMVLEEHTDNLPLRIKLGISYLEQHDFAKAMDTFVFAADAYPGSPEPYYYQGLVFLAQGLFLEAIEPYEKALSINDRYLQAYIDLGKIFIFFNECETAVPLFRKALNLSSQNPEALEGMDACRLQLPFQLQ